MGTGNSSFGDSYLLGALQVAKKLDVPFLYGLELAGTPEDVKKVQKGLEELFKKL